MKKCFQILGWLMLFQSQLLFADWAEQVFQAFGPEWIEKKSAEAPANSVAEDSRITSKWLPMCFFFDPSVGAEPANTKIREMVKQYAQCGVVLKPLAFTVKGNYPDDFKAVMELVRSACPIPKAFHVRGAIQMEARSNALARSMCQNPEAEGCSTLCSPLSVSFTGPDAKPETGLHESMHSNCCGPLCVDEGAGSGRSAGPGLELALGEHAPFQASVKISKGDLTISQEGCEALRAGSSPNAVGSWYQPKQDVYYFPEQDPAKQVDLLLGKNIFAKEEPKKVVEKVLPKTIASKLLKSLVVAKPAAKFVTREPASQARASAELSTEKLEPAKPKGVGTRAAGKGLRKPGTSGINAVSSYGDEDF